MRAIIKDQQGTGFSALHAWQAAQQRIRAVPPGGDANANFRITGFAIGDHVLADGCLADGLRAVFGPVRFGLVGEGGGGLDQRIFFVSPSRRGKVISKI